MYLREGLLDIKMFSKVLIENRVEKREDDERVTALSLRVAELERKQEQDDERVTALLLRVAELERKQEQDHKSNYNFITYVCFALLFMCAIMLINEQFARSSFRVLELFQDVLLSKARLFEGRIKDLEYGEIEIRRVVKPLVACNVWDFSELYLLLVYALVVDNKAF